MSFIPIDANLIRLGDIPSNVSVDISEAIISFDVSLTLDMSSQLTIEIIDKDFRFAKASYFQIRRDVFYQDLIFEITRVDVSRSSSLEPLYRIVARSKNIQLMKRDKKPESFRGQTATQFASIIAQRFNMGFFGENTIKAQTIVKARNSKNDESTWVVLERVAADNKFIIFETNNILFFTSEKNLLGKWGDPSYTLDGQKIVPFGWPEQDTQKFPDSNRKYILLEMPTFGRSDDDVNEADGTLVVDRENGRLLRPGMTVNISGIPDFEENYLISSVEFSEGVPDPVRISFRTPVTPEDPPPQRSGSGGGGGGISLPMNIQNSIKEFIARNTTQNSSEKYRVHTSKYELYVKEAIRLADQIWKATTVQNKTKLFAELQDKVKDFQGVLGPVFRAIVSVQSQLYANLTRPEPSLPESIKSAIRNYFAAKIGQGGQNLALDYSNTAFRDAYIVYSKTSVNAAQAEIVKLRNKYGANSLQYLVFIDLRVNTLLLASMPPVLGVNFPDVT